MNLTQEMTPVTQPVSNNNTNQAMAPSNSVSFPPSYNLNLEPKSTTSHNGELWDDDLLISLEAPALPDFANLIVGRSSNQSS